MPQTMQQKRAGSLYRLQQALGMWSRITEFYDVKYRKDDSLVAKRNSKMANLSRTISQTDEAISRNR
jgi:hypothetical protein